MQETNNLPGTEPTKPTPVESEAKKSRLPLLIAIAAVFLIAASAAGAFWYYQSNSKANSGAKPVPNNSADSSNPADNSNGTATSTSPVQTCQNPGQSTRQLSGQVNWTAQTEIPTPDIFDLADKTDGYVPGKYAAENSKFYRVGTLTSGVYKDGEVILADVAFEGPAFYPIYYHFIKQDSSYILLGKYPENSDSNVFDVKKIKVDAGYVLEDLVYPKSFVAPNRAELAMPDITATGKFCEDGLVKVFRDDTLGDVYTDKDSAKKGSFSNQSNGFYIAAPDGTKKVYALDILFVDKKNVPQVVWNDGKNNVQEYDYTDVGGCGSVNYLSVVPKDVVNPDMDLVAAGKNGQGETVYELKDPNHSLLKQIYENDYGVYGEQTKISYADFVASHPAFFWMDPFGRLVKFQNKKFVPMAECGKPVIYLYPTAEQKVSVKLEPQGNFTYTEPVYGNGWDVLATPEGKLTDLSTGLVYPYLFWEGRGGIYQTPQKGFMVAQGQVHGFLTEKLALLGLNQKETADFLEFWEPRMQGAPFYFVTFLGNRAMEQIAPLEISPKPDTIIRILMDYSPLQKPFPVEELQIISPRRRGFTVVEWGGVLRNNE